MIKRFFKKILGKSDDKEQWRRRILDVVNCPDNQFIPRVKEAGNVKNGFQLMHNGLKIKKDGYYGSGITRMLSNNQGVHEPQEERVFQEVLKFLPAKSIMIELGSYWSFYSMWFLNTIPNGKTYLYEPDPNNLKTGKINFQENKFTGDFNNAFIGDILDLEAYPVVLTVDYIRRDKKIDFIDILHCDIQSSELNMLNGALETIKDDKIRYFFISTHSNDLHRACLNFLIKHKYIIVCESDLSNTYSFDGLIVARSPNHGGVTSIDIAHK